MPDALDGLRPLLGPDTCILPMENGVETPEQLAKEFGWRHVLGGVCGIVSFIAEPGLIRHVAYEPFVNFGEWDNQPSERVDRLRRAFEGTRGLIVDTPADIQAAMWRKYILIASWSGIGGVTRAPIGVVRSQPGTRRLLETAMEEIHQVATALGVIDLRRLAPAEGRPGIGAHRAEVGQQHVRHVLVGAHPPRHRGVHGHLEIVIRGIGG